MPMLYLENVKLNAVVAMASNGIIGNGNDIPWEPPQIDMWRFRSLTLNKNIVMGYNTWKSLPNQLPYRKHFVLTSKKDHLPDNSQVVPVGSVNELGYIAEKDNIDNMFVIGGGSIFKTLWPVLNKVYMTRIDIKPQIWRSRGRIFLQVVIYRESAT